MPSLAFPCEKSLAPLGRLLLSLLEGVTPCKLLGLFSLIRIGPAPLALAFLKYYCWGDSVFIFYIEEVDGFSYGKKLDDCLGFKGLIEFIAFV